MFYEKSHSSVFTELTDGASSTLLGLPSTSTCVLPPLRLIKFVLPITGFPLVTPVAVRSNTMPCGLAVPMIGAEPVKVAAKL